MSPSKKMKDALKNAPKFDNPDEIFELISLWKDSYEQLESMQAKDPIYLDIAKKLHSKNPAEFPERTLYDIKRKVCYLRDQYTRLKPKISDSGISPVTDVKWAFYSAIHEILGSRPFYNEGMAAVSETSLSSDSSASASFATDQTGRGVKRKQTSDESNLSDSSDPGVQVIIDEEDDEASGSSPSFQSETPHVKSLKQKFTLRKMMEKQQEMLNAYKKDSEQSSVVQKELLNYLGESKKLLETSVQNQTMLTNVMTAFLTQLQPQNHFVPPPVATPTVPSVVTGFFQSPHLSAMSHILPNTGTPKTQSVMDMALQGLATFGQSGVTSTPVSVNTQVTQSAAQSVLHPSNNASLQTKSAFVKPKQILIRPQADAVTMIKSANTGPTFPSKSAFVKPKQILVRPQADAVTTINSANTDVTSTAASVNTQVTPSVLHLSNNASLQSKSAFVKRKQIVVRPQADAVTTINSASTNLVQTHGSQMVHPQFAPQGVSNSDGVRVVRLAPQRAANALRLPNSVIHRRPQL